MALFALIYVSLCVACLVGVWLGHKLTVDGIL